MHEKKKTYDRVIFTPEVVKEAVEALMKCLPKNKRNIVYEIFSINLSSREERKYDSEDEFFADYRKDIYQALFVKNYGISEIIFSVHLWHSLQDTDVTIKMPSRAEVEKVFNVLEANVDTCRLPKQRAEKPGARTDWVNETVEKVGGYCPAVGRKLNLALDKLESDEAEEWQSAAMLIRDAWIELAQHLCKVNEVDTSDIKPDAVIDRLKRLGIEKTDEKIFDLARASFNLSMKHHARKIDKHTAIACVISAVVSMQTVIREVFNAAGEDRGGQSNIKNSERIKRRR